MIIALSFNIICKKNNYNKESLGFNLAKFNKQLIMGENMIKSCTSLCVW